MERRVAGAASAGSAASAAAVAGEEIRMDQTDTVLAWPDVPPAASGRPNGATAHALIEMSHITKTYKMGEQEVHALRDVSLRIERGEFVAIMGPSGGGKTTLMNVMGCLDRPTSGTYVLEGRDVSTLSDDEQALVRSRMVGLV